MSSVNYAKAIGIFGSGLLSGGYIYISLFTTPTVRSNSETTPSEPVHGRWKHISGTAFPAVSIATAVAFGYISWYTGKASERVPFAVSALSTLAVLPYTWLVMKKNNDGLSSDEETIRGKSDGQRPKSLKARGRQHLVRAGLITVSFGTALMAVVFDEGGPTPPKLRLSSARRLLM